MANSNLTSAKKAKNDEFYTQYPDIEKEISAYVMYDPNTFRDKVVYCNCDDPLESNFFAFFALNFKRLGLRRLITTSYKPSPIANTLFDLSPYETMPSIQGREKEFAARFIIDDVGDIDKNGSFNVQDVYTQLKANKHNEWKVLQGDANYPAGDFRSVECIELLKQSDIVVTNPPFSLFREYVAQLMEHKKRFVIIGNMNAITYKEIFPLIKANKLWLGTSNFNTGMYFEVPDDFIYAPTYKFARVQNGKRVNRVPGVCWFSNIDHGRRHQPLMLMTMADNRKYNKKIRDNEISYQRYDNYDAIEVPFTDGIPSDYHGAIGVPISFLDKYSPEQFEIIKFRHGDDGKDLSVNGKCPYFRILIKHRKVVE
ncbi:MAG: adenine-specific methyltransferase EcoRI family protein [Candidatus Saccharimonas sp.]|nr:adenine-specific methyltransferase EcoRI family protein [Candidatus Saccharimonas sp.]